MRKAFLYAEGRDVVLGHSVEELATQAADYDGAFGGEAARAWSELDGHYLPTRYPNSLPGSIPAKVYSVSAATRAVELAGQVVETVQTRLAEMASRAEEQEEGPTATPGIED